MLEMALDGTFQNNYERWPHGNVQQTKNQIVGSGDVITAKPQFNEIMEMRGLNAR